MPLVELKRADINARRRKGETMVDIAASFGICTSALQRFMHRGKRSDVINARGPYNRPAGSIEQKVAVANAALDATSAPDVVQELLDVLGRLRRAGIERVDANLIDGHVDIVGARRLSIPGGTK